MQLGIGFTLKYIFVISSIFIAIPLFAVWKWRRLEDRGRFPFLGVASCWLIPLFFVFFGAFGPFYSIVEPVGVTSGKEYFSLLSKEQLPIKFVLFGGFIAQFFINARVLAKARAGQGYILFSFGLLAIYCSVFTLLFAADSLFAGGLG